MLMFVCLFVVVVLELRFPLCSNLATLPLPAFISEDSCCSLSERNSLWAKYVMSSNPKHKTESLFVLQATACLKRKVNNEVG